MCSIIKKAVAHEASQYLLVLSPPGIVCQEIWDVKYEMAGTDLESLAIRTGPHITLVFFLAYPWREEQIVNHLQRIGRSIAPFIVELKDYGCFVSSNTIFIKVANETSVRYVVRELKGAKQFLKRNVAYSLKYSDKPHVSIYRECILFNLKWNGLYMLTGHLTEALRLME